MTTLVDGSTGCQVATAVPTAAGRHDNCTSMSLEERTIIVTGAASGIGRATTSALRALGASVVAVDRDDDLLGQLAAHDRPTDDGGGRLATITGDLRDTDTADAAVDRALDIGQPLAGAVLCAGSAATGSLSTTSDTDFAEMIEANVAVHFRLTRRLLRLCQEGAVLRDGCSLVYVASKHAVSPNSGFGAYPLAKAAELQLARLAAVEGAPYGLRANVVNPGAVFHDSRFWTPELIAEKAAAHRVPPSRLADFYAKRTLLGVTVTPDDVGRAIIFFLSPWSRAMTGCVLAVDGGLTATFGR